MRTHTRKRTHMHAHTHPPTYKPLSFSHFWKTKERLTFGHDSWAWSSGMIPENDPRAWSPGRSSGMIPGDEPRAWSPDMILGHDPRTWSAGMIPVKTTTTFFLVPRICDLQVIHYTMKYIFSRVQATLYLTMSVCQSVGLSVITSFFIALSRTLQRIPYIF